MKRSLVGFTLAMAALSAPAQVGLPPQSSGPQDGTPSVSTGSVPLTYTGGDSRASVGVDKDGNTQGELSSVFGNNGEHAIVAQLWWQNGGAGGVQADYNWLLGATLEQAKADPESITVAKLSFAIDQNAQKDRQANVGFAIERKEFFLNFYLAGKISGTRNAGAEILQQQGTQAGSDDIGNYIQTQTQVATTPLSAQAYTYTVGAHGGHFSDALAARFNGGFDYSRGNQGAHESRYSVGIDKYLGTHGWSVSGIAEHAQSSIPFSGSRSDDRWWFFVRYEFGGGGAFTAAPADSAWIQRALRQPVVGHPRDVKTYITRGKTTTTTTLGAKQYTARRPLAHDDSASVAQDSTGNAIDVLANDNDPDGGLLVITAVGSPANGSAQIAGSRVVYAPAPGFVGADEFGYTITDPKGLSATARVHVTITPIVLRPPVAQDDTATTAYAMPVTVAVLANDSDPNGFVLTVTGTTPPAHGSVRVNGDGTIAYTPAAGFTGTDRFSYTIGNGHGGSATAHVTVSVQPPLPPVAQNDTATTPLQTPVVIAVLANDSDPNGFALTVTSVSAPANGTARLNSNRTVTYTPLGLFFGTDTFSYSISNGHGGSASATVTVTVSAPSGAFIAQDDTATTGYAKPVAINVLLNDSAPAGLALTLVGASQPAHGTVQPGNGGVVTYTPSSAFNGGTDAFSYTVSDGLDTASATVTVTVLPPGAPLAQNDTATTAFNTPVTISVLANDSDPSGFPLSLASATTPAHGTAVLNQNGTVTYTPQATYAGSDAFSYTVSNGHGGTATAAVTVTVQPPPPPVAQADSATTPFNKPVSIAVLANDSDPVNLPLSVTQTSQPAHGTATIGANGMVTYTPQSTYSGTDTFSYTISDGYQSASANVTVGVQPPLPPIAVADAVTTPFGTTVKISVLANDSDPNGLPLTVTAVTPTNNVHASATVNADGTISYKPDPESSGQDSFSYTISNTYFTASAVVTVTVQAALPPVAQNDFMLITFNTPTEVPVLANDSDPNGLPLTILTPVTTLPQHGTATVNNVNGTITYSPNLAPPPIGTEPQPYVGSDTFSYTITNSFITATATVTVNVQPPPKPVAVDDAADCNGGLQVNIAVLDNDVAQFGLPLKVIGTTAPVGGGSVLLNGDNTITYNDDVDSGPRVDTFSYTITDPYGQQSTATVTVTIIN